MGKKSKSNPKKITKSNFGEDHRIASKAFASKASIPLPPICMDTLDTSSCAKCNKKLDVNNWEAEESMVLMPCCGLYLCASCEGPRQQKERGHAVNQQLLEEDYFKSLGLKKLDMNTQAMKKKFQERLFEIYLSKRPKCQICQTPDPEQPKDVVKRFRRLAQSGHAGGFYSLGRLYSEGEGGKFGIRQDKNFAFDCFLKASRLGLSHSQVKMGDSYMSGKGVNCSFDNAREWYERAAEQNHAKAMHALGCMYRDGKGVPIQTEKAMEYFKSSAEQSYPPACKEYGVCLKKKSELDEAQKCFLQGAANETHISDFIDDISLCQSNAATIILERDKKELFPHGLYWANRAVRNGDSKSKIVVKEYRENIWKECAQCGKPNPKSRCSGCHGAAYCDSKCQKLAWKEGHKIICKPVSSGSIVKKGWERYSPKECSFCGKSEPTFACSRCGEAWYCDEQCRSLHWRGVGDCRICAHQGECRKKRRLA